MKQPGLSPTEVQPIFVHTVQEFHKVLYLVRYYYSIFFFINDLFFFVKQATIYNYADDTTIAFSPSHVRATVLPIIPWQQAINNEGYHLSQSVRQSSRNFPKSTLFTVYLSVVYIYFVSSHGLFHCD